MDVYVQRQLGRRRVIYGQIDEQAGRQTVQLEAGQGRTEEDHAHLIIGIGIGCDIRRRLAHLFVLLGLPDWRKK